MPDHLSAHFCSSVFKPEPESKIYELIKPDFEDKAIFIDLSLFLKKLNNLIFFSTISKFKPRQPCCINCMLVNHLWGEEHQYLYKDLFCF